MKSMFKGAFGALVVVLALSGLTAASALASAPTVETVKAAGVTETTAVLNGTVDPNGIETNVYAEYGPTISYGTTTKEHNAGSGTQTVGESWNASKLTPNTSYHFRVVAKNSKGEATYGSDLTFFTGAYPPGLPEFAVSEGKITELKWEAPAENVVWEVTAGKSWECTSGLFTGTAIGAKTVSGRLVFTGCFQGSSGCKTPGAKENEVVVEDLEGTLVYLSKTAKTVGLNLKAKTGTLIIPKFTCFGIPGEARGSIIFPFTNKANKMEQYIGWDVEAREAVQSVNEYEKETGVKVHSSLETTWPSGWGPLAWGLGDFYTKTNKPFEIKA